MNEKANPKRFTRTRMIVIGIFCTCIILFLLRGAILERVAEGLVWRDRAPLSADILVMGGDGAVPAMLAWLAAHDNAKLLLLEKPPPRVVQIGVIVSEAERRKALAAAAGIPQDRIEILLGKSMRKIRPVSMIDQWLSAHPGRRIHLFCDQFQSRRLRRAVSRLDAEKSSRITIEPRVDRRFTVNDWWTSRLGMRAVFDGYLGLLSSLWGLHSTDPPTYLSPDQYEQAFLDSLQLKT